MPDSRAPPVNAATSMVLPLLTLLTTAAGAPIVIAAHGPVGRPPPRRRRPSPLLLRRASRRRRWARRWRPRRKVAGPAIDDEPAEPPGPEPPAAPPPLAAPAAPPADPAAPSVAPAPEPAAPPSAPATAPPPSEPAAPAGLFPLEPPQAASTRVSETARPRSETAARMSRTVAPAGVASQFGRRPETFAIGGGVSRRGSWRQSLWMAVGEDLRELVEPGAAVALARLAPQALARRGGASPGGRSPSRSPWRAAGAPRRCSRGRSASSMRVQWGASRRTSHALDAHARVGNADARWRRLRSERADARRSPTATPRAPSPWPRARPGRRASRRARRSAAAPGCPCPRPAARSALADRRAGIAAGERARGARRSDRAPCAARPSCARTPPDRAARGGDPAQPAVRFLEHEGPRPALEPLAVAVEDRVAGLAPPQRQVVVGDGEVGADRQAHEVLRPGERRRLVEVVDAPDQAPVERRARSRSSRRAGRRRPRRAAARRSERRARARAGTSGRTSRA